MCDMHFILCLQLAREVMDTAAKNIRVGITTDELDRVVHEVIQSVPNVAMTIILACEALVQELRVF